MEVADDEMLSPSWEGLVADFDVADGFSTEMASKAQLLHSLSSFLSCVAATLSFSSEDQLVSAWVRGSKVCIRDIEVLQLHEQLLSELQNQTLFLSASSWTSNKHIPEREESDDILSRTLHLEVVSQTLRCCVRILPLLDCFDKNVSLGCAKMLDGTIQRLCSPSVLFNLLGLTLPTGEHFHESRCTESSQILERNVGLETTDRGAGEQFSVEKAFGCAGVSDVLASQDSRDRMEIIFAILEVYMDELLINLPLNARLWSSREGIHWLGKEEQLASNFRHSEASLDMTFVHVLLSFLMVHSQQMDQAPHTVRNNSFLVCNLSLPAGFLLLEKFSAEEVPPLYITHIILLVARILNDTTLLDFDQVDELMRSRQNVVDKFWAGEVDWSYCIQERLPNCDLGDGHLNTNGFDPETTLHFVSEILEHAILLYMKFSMPSEPHIMTKDSTGPALQCQKLQCPLLSASMSKYKPIIKILSESLELNVTDKMSQSKGLESEELEFERDDRHCCASEVMNTHCDSILEVGSGYFGSAREKLHFGNSVGIHGHSMGYPGARCPKRGRNSVLKREDIDDASGLMIALLQLMSSAVECIGREVCKLACSPDGFEHQFVDGQELPAEEFNEGGFDEILYSVGLHLSLCCPSDKSFWSKYNMAQHARAKQDLDGQKPLNELVGQAIIFFTDILRSEVHKGTPDAVLQEYFHLVESLLALLVVVDQRNSSRHCTNEYGSGCMCIPPENACRNSGEVLGCKACKRCPAEDGIEQVPHGKSTSRLLEALVLSLEGILEDLYKQQRAMPEFLLLFVLKQVSKADGLNLVAMIFNSCHNGDVEAQETIIHNPEVFHPGRLVMQMAQLALVEPTRPHSLSILIDYMINILKDLLPITATILLCGNTEEISCYENIAYNLTLACQLAVCEQRMFAKNGQKHFMSLTSKMCQGIGCLITQGTTVAHWLSDLSEKMSETAWQKFTGVSEVRQTTLSAGEMECEFWEQAGSFEKCNSFLEQINVLWNAVQGLVNRDCLFDAELEPLLRKGDTFFMALLGLLAGDKLPRCQWSNLFPNNQQSPACDFQNPTQVMDGDLDQGCVHYEKGTDFQWVEERTRKRKRRRRRKRRRQAERWSWTKNINSFGPGVDLWSHDLQSSSHTFDRKKLEDSQRSSKEVFSGDRMDETLVCRTHACDPSSTMMKQSTKVINEKLGLEQENTPLERCDASDLSSMINQISHSSDVASAEKLVFEQENDLLEEQEDELHNCRKSLANDLSASVNDPVLSKFSVPEKRVTRSATLLNSQKLEAEADVLSIPNERKPHSPATSAIIRRLLHHRPPSRKKSISTVQFCTAREETSEQGLDPAQFLGLTPNKLGWTSNKLGLGLRNSYVDCLSNKDSKEYDDLKDFIVPKKGRNYSEWFKRRKTIRRRLHTRNYFKRLQQKRDLLVLLDLG